ncbi:MAG: tetratricopeptide repeat protein [Simkaniaceae bacterium]|nr:MAG: tetratricopeptide repeat protein [Simkaniaceae bacterium]
MLSAKEKAKIEQALYGMSGILERTAPLNKNYSADDLRILSSFARTLYQSGDYEEAKGVYQQLAAFEPYCPSYWEGVGACMQMEKRYEEALRAWSMVSLLSEDDPLPHFHAAECYNALGLFLEGEKELDACKERLKENHQDLLEKIARLESNWTKEEGA